jgi:cell division septum initiation protein DivIVA
MFRRADAALVSGEVGADAHPRVPVAAVPEHRPDVAGALDGLLTAAPVFRSAVRGYDRLEVDNYVAWAESEITAARRETDDLMTRYGQASAELEIARRLLAQSPEGQELTFVSERMGRMLQMAADEASEITATATADADRILAEARADADARLRKAHEIKQLAVASSDRMREEAEQLRAAAAAELERARQQAEQYLRETAAQVRREAEAATAAAQAQLATLQGEVQELRRRRDQACEHLRRLNDQIGEAIDALSGDEPVRMPADFRSTMPPNFVVDRAPVHS